MAKKSELIRERRIGYALDASAVLAFLGREAGTSWISGVLDVSIMSAVNWAEVLAKSLEHGVDLRDASGLIQALGIGIVPFSELDAEEAAELRQGAKARRLSLGDSACLVLARRYEATALTADPTWQDLDLDIEVQLVRKEVPMTPKVDPTGGERWPAR